MSILTVKINDVSINYEYILDSVIETDPEIYVYKIITEKYMKWNHTLPFLKTYNNSFQDAGGDTIECYLDNKLITRKTSWNQSGRIFSTVLFIDTEIQVGPIIFEYNKENKLIKPISFETRDEDDEEN